MLLRPSLLVHWAWPRNSIDMQLLEACIFPFLPCLQTTVRMGNGGSNASMRNACGFLQLLAKVLVQDIVHFYATQPPGTHYQRFQPEVVRLMLCCPAPFHKVLTMHKQNLQAGIYEQLKPRPLAGELALSMEPLLLRAQERSAPRTASGVAGHSAQAAPSHAACTSAGDAAQGVMASVTTFVKQHAAPHARDEPPLPVGLPLTETHVFRHKDLRQVCVCIPVCSCLCEQFSKKC